MWWFQLLVANIECTVVYLDLDSFGHFVGSKGGLDTSRSPTRFSRFTEDDAIPRTQLCFRHC